MGTLVTGTCLYCGRVIIIYHGPAPVPWGDIDLERPRCVACAGASRVRLPNPPSEGEKTPRIET